MRLYVITVKSFEDFHEQTLSRSDEEVQEDQLAWNLIHEAEHEYALRNFEVAVDKYAEALDILVQIHGELADKCANIYIKYGQALLEMARGEIDDVFLGRSALEQVSEGW